MSTTMTMVMGPTSTSSMIPIPSATMGVAHEDMGMGGPGACKISMTWNWYTVGSCFISKQWQITSSGMFAGSCIGVILLVISLEFLRRASREFDAYAARKLEQKKDTTLSSLVPRPSSTQLLGDVEGVSYSGRDRERHRDNNKDNKLTVTSTAKSDLVIGTTLRSSPSSDTHRKRSPGRSDLIQVQLLRALLHMVQFAVAYFVMLLAMYYNGYFIICILIGAFSGAFIFTWDQTVNGLDQSRHQPAELTGCCG